MDWDDAAEAADEELNPGFLTDEDAVLDAEADRLLGREVKELDEGRCDYCRAGHRLKEEPWRPVAPVRTYLDDREAYARVEYQVCADCLADTTRKYAPTLELWQDRALERWFREQAELIALMWQVDLAPEWRIATYVARKQDADRKRKADHRGDERAFRQEGERRRIEREAQQVERSFFVNARRRGLSPERWTTTRGPRRVELCELARLWVDDCGFHPKAVANVLGFQDRRMRRALSDARHNLLSASPSSEIGEHAKHGVAAQTAGGLVHLRPASLHDQQLRIAKEPL